MKKYSKETERAIKVWNSRVKDGGFGVSKHLVKWVEDKVVPKRAFATGHRAWCSKCGQSFLTEKTKGKEVCPHCGSKLKVEKSRCWRKEDIFYVQELTTWAEFQVVRTYIVSAWASKKNLLRVYVWHAYDWMISENGKAYCFSRSLTAYPRYRKIPFSISDLPNRPPMRYKKSAAYSEWHNGWIINGHYSKRKYQPWLTKFDIKGRLMDSDMYSVIINLLKGTPHFETMWKKRDKVLCSAFMYGESSQRLWPQIKIALRHGFKFKDWRMWVDHIDMLGREGYDIFNPQYIAPADLKQAHRKLNAEHEERLRKEEEERERIRQLEEIERNKALTDPNSPLNIEYRNRIGKVLAVVVRSGNISIQPLQNIKDFYEEGKALHHCVYANKYYAHSGCLILGAKVGGKRTETIELNLRTMQIEQCRGKYNQDSKYHEAIYSLMQSSIGRFRGLKCQNA